MGSRGTELAESRSGWCHLAEACVLERVSSSTHQGGNGFGLGSEVASWMSTVWVLTRGEVPGLFSRTLQGLPQCSLNPERLYLISREPSQVWEKCPWPCVRVYGCKTLSRVTVGRLGDSRKGPSQVGRHLLPSPMLMEALSAAPLSPPPAPPGAAALHKDRPCFPGREAAGTSPAGH